MNKEISIFNIIWVFFAHFEYESYWCTIYVKVLFRCIRRTRLSGTKEGRRGWTRRSGNLQANIQHAPSRTTAQIDTTYKFYNGKSSYTLETFIRIMHFSITRWRRLKELHRYILTVSILELHIIRFLCVWIRDDVIKNRKSGRDGSTSPRMLSTQPFEPTKGGIEWFLGVPKPHTVLVSDRFFVRARLERDDDDDDSDECVKESRFLYSFSQNRYEI